MDVRVVDARDVLDEWQALAEQTQVSPFLQPNWLLAWSESFAGTGLVLAIAGRPDGRLTAALPLQSVAAVLRSPTNWHTPDFGLIAGDSAAAEPLLHGVLAIRPRRLQLAFLDETLARTVQSVAADHGYRVLARVLEKSPYLPLTADFATYQECLSQHLRAELARRRRRLDEMGAVRVEVEEAYDEALVEEFLRVEASGWKGSAGTAIAARPDTRAFYTRVAQWGDARGWLRLAFLRLDGQALAADLALEAGGVHYLVKTAFRPDARRYAPGKLLRHAMLERAFALGLRSYEFLGRDEPWKLEWTRQVRPRWLVQAFAPTPLGALDYAAYAYGRPLTKSVLAQSRRWRAR
jgi:CelD/BcsL family acetyltransferase involved in cellulose biosynthesis